MGPLDPAFMTELHSGRSPDSSRLSPILGTPSWPYEFRKRREANASRIIQFLTKPVARRPAAPVAMLGSDDRTNSSLIEVKATNASPLIFVVREKPCPCVLGLGRTSQLAWRALGAHLGPVGACIGHARRWRHCGINRSGSSRLQLIVCAPSLSSHGAKGGKVQRGVVAPKLRGRWAVATELRMTREGSRWFRL